MPLLIPPAYEAITVTLTTGDTLYKLSTLIQAALTNQAQGRNIIAEPREMTLQSDHDNTAGSSIRVGDEFLVATLCGVRLKPGDSKTYRSSIGNIPLSAMYVRSTVNSALLNVELQAF